MDTKNSSVSKKSFEENIEFVVPGMELAHTVYSKDLSILANAGTIINTELIKKLRKWDITKVDIVAEVADNPFTNPNIEKFLNTYNQSIDVIQKTFDSIRQTQDIPVEAFSETADDIVNNIADAENINIIDKLYDLPVCDDYTIRHCVNVSAISALIAKWLKYSTESITAVALAGLLHDVGKSQLPPEILNKPYKLSPADYKLYQTHTKLGYELARKKENISQSILFGIFHHHERTDRSGYPMHLGSDDIHPYAKIIAVADLFDESLTINCDFPGATSPYASLDNIRDRLYCFDPKISLIFRDHMMNFLSGHRVMLSNKQEGRVVFINRDKPSKSIVQLDNGTVLNLPILKDVNIHYVIK